MTIRRVAVPAISVILALTLVACGSDDDDAAAEGSALATSEQAGGATTVAAGTLNEADTEFAQGMIAHHEQAIEMAEIALDPNVGASPEVVALATRVKAAQDPEVELMAGWLTSAGEPVAMDTTDGHEMSSMEGMMTIEQMEALAAATGPDFDRMWLEMMIAHHQGAIAQSESVTAEGSNPEVLALADQIITAQQGEISEMQGLLDG
jgi:uncharacterized protein (DUF305 family)